jgi:hypothetical protein
MTIVLLLSIQLKAGEKTIATDIPEYRIKMAEKNYMVALKRNMPTLSESTLFNIILMKNMYPERDYDRILKSVERMAIRDKMPEVRYKAYLTAMYLTFFDSFSELEITRSENPDPYFDAIADQLQTRLLSVNR